MESTRHDSDEKINALWSWFSAVSTRLAENYENQDLLDELEDRVSALGEVSWELGPGIAKECALTLSPDGDPGKLAVTQRAVAMAPELPSWEFYPARQKKEWELQFSVDGSDGRVLEVDARPWRYVLLRFPDGTFDIVIEQANLADVDQEDRYTAAVIVLDGILGEATRLLAIQVIEPTDALSTEQSKKANSISVLEDHFSSLRS